MIFALLALACAKAPILGTDAPEGSFVPGEYIVIYYENTTTEQATRHWEFAQSLGIELRYTYEIGDTFKGFAAKLSDELLTLMQYENIVSKIYANAIAHTQQTCDFKQEKAPSWGLARVSHVGKVGNEVPLKDYYSYNGSPNGKGVNAYVLDTGVFVNHPDIRGRAIWGYNAVDPGNDNDRNGHGTHCAGTIAGTQYGVAKQANIIAVKVLGDTGSGSYAGIIAGINWASADFEKRKANGEKGIVSMSLGGGSTGGMEEAIKAAYGKGLPFSVAAGNSNADACNFYPAGFKDIVITVGATDGTDARSSYSNYGTCVDLFAPGSAITSIWFDGTTAVLSGTSMACPHVTGYAANLLSTRDFTPDQLLLELRANSQANLLTNIGTGSPNYLLYNGCR